MKNEILNQYKLLVNFLGKSLGPSFEVVLHEVKGEEVKMIAIANGEVSDRVLEDTVSSETLNILKNKSSHNEESMVNHTVLLKNGKKVRSSSMLIKENQKVVGMLCINFDDSKFHELNCQLLRIIHQIYDKIKYYFYYLFFSANAMYLYTVDVEQNNFLETKSIESFKLKKTLSYRA